jgi:3-deoxy-D-manno-octulosonic-acid transferase
MYLLYSALLATSLLLGLPYWLLQMMRHGKYRAGLAERFGRVPARLTASPDLRPILWIHAVSVGEVLATAGLITEWRRRRPQDRIVISTTTLTGQQLARDRCGAENVFYFPLDFAFAVRPYLNTLRPQMIVVAETEFWPNFLRLAKAGGARIAVVNARISDRSWPGYRRFRSWLTRVLQNVDLFLAQGEEDRRRLMEIGAPADRVEVSGNLKFDVAAPAAAPVVARLRETLADALAGPVLVCGSTMEGEEPLLLNAFKHVLASHPRAVMVLAPRHPERFTPVANLVAELGIRCWRRSLWNGESIASGVFLLDTIGELPSMYSLATVAFVGGSLVPRGGHNILEPAQFGAPIVIGTSWENFRDIVSLFRSHDAVRIVGPAELPLVFLDLLQNEAERTALGQRAAETVRQQSGATLRTANALEKLLARTNPQPATRGPAHDHVGARARATPPE